MSILGSRGPPALSRHYGRVCSRCSEHVQLPHRRHSPTLTLILLGRQYATGRPNPAGNRPAWRKEPARRTNLYAPTAQEEPESFAPDPSSKDGLLSRSYYSKEAAFSPIPLDLVPEHTNDDFDDSYRTLDSTRPAILEIVTQLPDEPLYKYLYRLGKSYLSFYKTGLKNIRRNWRERSELRNWCHPFTMQGIARYGGTPHYTRNKEMIPIPHISRRDYIFNQRTLHDLWKLLPFGLLFLCCGEFTPIAILILGNRITPYTCRIPAQQRKSLDDALDRFRLYIREMRRLTTHSVPDPKHTFDFQPPSLKREHTWKRDALFAHLVAKTNFSTLPFPIMGSLYFRLLLFRRLTGYWDSIFCDNILIRRGGGFAALSPLDLFDYALNYGSFSLLVIMQHEIKHKRNYNFINEDLKARLVPILEAEADAILTDDFTRLDPRVHWMRAYRDSMRWGRHTPDIHAALKLMNEFGMHWSTDASSWGGDWKFDTPPVPVELNAKGKPIKSDAQPLAVVQMVPSPKEVGGK
jgi:hypothetical protein